MNLLPRAFQWLLLIMPWVLSILLVPVCFAQDANAPQPVRGIVLNSLNRTPIGRALVESNGELNGQSNGEAVLTDSTGHFELSVQPGSSNAITVRKPGYATGAGSVHIVRAEGHPVDLTFVLTPQAVITGHISSGTGEDADGTRVVLYRQQTLRGQHWWQVQGSAETDSGGHFRMSNLQTPAQYLLMTVPRLAQVTGRESQTGRQAAASSTAGYPAAFYPEGGENSIAGLLSLSPGQQATTELTVNRQPFYRVTIRLKNDVGVAPLTVQVHDETGLATDLPAQWNAEKHSATADLPNGHYFAELRSYERSALYGRVEFTVAGAPVTGLTAVVLPLRPVLVSIHKDFTSSPNTPTGGLTVGLTNEIRGGTDPGVNVVLIPLDGATGQVGSLTPMPGSADPLLFRMAGITPGRYLVQATAYEGYISSITSGGVDLLREALVVGPGNTTPPMDVTLRNDGAQIHCTIQHSLSPDSSSEDGGLVAVYAVPVSPASGRATGGQPLQAVPANQNEALLSNLAPGAYSVMALDHVIDLYEMEPALLDSYVSKGQTVAVQAQGATNVTLPLIHVADTGAEQEAAP